MARRSGLGRGLESLLGETAGEVGDESGGVSEIDLGSIERNPDQPRKTFDQQQMDELADSIRRNGVLQPILVRPYGEGYQIVAGERRYQAARMAGLDSIPAVVRELDDEKVYLLALIENLQRTDLNVMEEAQGYRTLMEKNGLTQAQLAEVLSKSRSAIANILRLMDLPDEVQQLVGEGKLTAGHARAVLSVDNEDGQIRLANKVVAEGLSVRQTESLAPLFSGREKKARQSKASQPASYKRAAKDLRNALKTRVNVHTVRGKNKIEIEFEDDEQLERLVTLLGGSRLDDTSSTHEGDNA